MRLLNDATQAIYCVLAAALYQGVISDDLRNRGLPNMWGNGRCGCYTATLHVDGLIFKQARVSCSLHGARCALVHATGHPKFRRWYPVEP